MYNESQQYYYKHICDKCLDRLVKEQRYDKITERGYHEYLCQNKKYDQKFRDVCLTESDFYPPPDDRESELYSYVEDIDGGDNFTDYCEEFFELCEEEGYYD